MPVSRCLQVSPLPVSDQLNGPAPCLIVGTARCPQLMTGAQEMAASTTADRRLVIEAEPVMFCSSDSVIGPLMLLHCLKRRALSLIVLFGDCDGMGFGCNI